MMNFISVASSLLMLSLVLTTCHHPSNSTTISQPNVLFIAIDDLNDWTETLGGHPQAITPNLKAFAEESVEFRKNYCTNPGCNPSRSTLMTGYHTYTSGMYSNYQDWRKVPKMANTPTLGEYFRQNGYYSAGAGKIFHYSQVAPDCWDDYYPSQTKNMPDNYIPEGAPVNMPEFQYMYKAFDWEPIPIADSATGDYKSVSYITQQLQKDHEKPFFLACGIYRPHLPWYVPQKYFDLFPIEDIELPDVGKNDTADLGIRAKELITRGGNYHKHVLEAGQWKQAVQGYLASVAFADAMFGELLTALKASNYADNTIIVLWSDHGWQLGEKMHWRKFALWENVIRTLLMIKVPEGVKALPEGSSNGAASQNITSLIDIYPTLVELCDLPARTDLDGRSLVPLLQNPSQPWDEVAITTYDYGDYSVRSQNYHYIHYIDDSEELYDLAKDPNEWTNLAGIEQMANIKAQLKGYIPTDPAPFLDATLIPIMPHHIPPITSKEMYMERRSRELPTSTLD